MLNNTPNFARLRSLYLFLMDVPNEQVNMDTVIPNVKDIDFGKVKAGEPLECGAVGCAIGWASLMPEFRSAGLKFTKKGSLKLNGEITSFDVAGMELFDLTKAESQWLFGPKVASEAGLTDKDVFYNRYRALCVLHNEQMR